MPLPTLVASLSSNHHNINSMNHLQRGILLLDVDRAPEVHLIHLVRLADPAVGAEGGTATFPLRIKLALAAVAAALG